MQKTAKSLDELYCDMIKAEKYLQRIIKENWPTRRIDAARYSYSQAQQKYNETESNFFTHKNLER